MRQKLLTALLVIANAAVLLYLAGQFIFVASDERGANERVTGGREVTGQLKVKAPTQRTTAPTGRSATRAKGEGRDAPGRAKRGLEVLINKVPSVAPAQPVLPSRPRPGVFAADEGGEKEEVKTALVTPVPAGSAPPGEKGGAGSGAERVETRAAGETTAAGGSSLEEASNDELFWGVQEAAKKGDEEAVASHLLELIHRGAAGVPVLSALVSNPTNAMELRVAAGAGLAQVGSDVALAELIAVLRDAPEGDFKETLGTSLKMVTNPDAGGFLTNALLDSDDALVAGKLSIGLAQVINADNAETLMTSYALEEGGSVRNNAIEALFRSLDRPEVVEGLGRVMAGEPTTRVARLVVDTLGNIGNQEAAELIVEGLEKYQDDAEMQTSLLGAVMRSKSEALPVYSETLQSSENPEMVTELAAAMGEMGSKDAVYALLDAVEGIPDEQTRLGVLKGITLVSKEEAMPLLESLADDDRYPEVQQFSRMALEKMTIGVKGKTTGGEGK